MVNEDELCDKCIREYIGKIFEPKKITKKRLRLLGEGKNELIKKYKINSTIFDKWHKNACVNAYLNKCSYSIRDDYKKIDDLEEHMSLIEEISSKYKVAKDTLKFWIAQECVNDYLNEENELYKDSLEKSNVNESIKNKIVKKYCIDKNQLEYWITSVCINEYVIKRSELMGEEVTATREQKESNIVDQITKKYSISAETLDEWFSKAYIDEYKIRKKDAKKNIEQKLKENKLFSSKAASLKAYHTRIENELCLKYTIEKDDLRIKIKQNCGEEFKKGKTEDQLKEEFGVDQKTINTWLHSENISEVERKMVKKSKVLSIDNQKELYEYIAKSTLYSLSNEWSENKTIKYITNKFELQVSKEKITRKFVREVVDIFQEYYRNISNETFKENLEDEEKFKNKIKYLEGVENRKRFVFLDYIKLKNKKKESSIKSKKKKKEGSIYLVICRTDSLIFTTIVNTNYFTKEMKGFYSKIERHVLSVPIVDMILPKEVIFLKSNNLNDEIDLDSRKFNIIKVDERFFKNLRKNKYESNDNPIVREIKEMVDEKGEKFEPIHLKNYEKIKRSNLISLL